MNEWDSGCPAWQLPLPLCRPSRFPVDLHDWASTKGGVWGHEMKGRGEHGGPQEQVCYPPDGRRTARRAERESETMVIQDGVA